jgi:hypothetical protein
VENGVQNLCHVPLTRAQTARQVPHRSLHARAKTPDDHLGGTRGLGLDTTCQTGQRVLAIRFAGHFGFNPRQISHLMPHRLKVLAQLAPKLFAQLSDFGLQHGDLRLESLHLLPQGDHNYLDCGFQSSSVMDSSGGSGMTALSLNRRFSVLVFTGYTEKIGLSIGIHPPF